MKENIKSRHQKHGLETSAVNTWCKGCGNFGILTALKSVLAKREDTLGSLVLVSGIGCHAKIVDYVAVNSFYSIHGRVLPVACGIKTANPRLTIIGHAGDGDAYGEGISHLVFAAKRNNDLVFIVHNNRVYGLTTGQFTPTSPKGFKGRSTPKGSIEEPFNPLRLMLASGATFVARGYAGKHAHLASLIEQAMVHPGFAFIDVLQPCFTFYNTYKFYNEKVVEIRDEHPVDDFDAAWKLAGKWDYGLEADQIPIGIFYRIRKDTYEEELLPKETPSLDVALHLKRHHF